METFFVQHHGLQDRDEDELSGRVNSDSEASDNDEETTKRVRSVNDPTGPWNQQPVNSETWGKPGRASWSSKGRDFASTHTGPKGVISDYKAHKQYQSVEHRRKEEERKAVLNRITKGAVAPFAPLTRDSTAHVECASDSESDSDCDMSDVGDDMAFLAQYTEMRVKQMQQVARSRKVYGGLEYITPEQFIALVSNTGSGNVSNTGSGNVASRMLVHLYHPDNYACGLLNTQLKLLARKLVHVKFAAMVAKDADASIEMADLPVMLIFRNQQQQETIIDVTRRLDGEFTFDRVEAFVNEQLAL